MNQTEWLAGDDPLAMLAQVESSVSDRKLRLFACACARRCWGLFRWPAPRTAVELAERLAEGAADPQQREELVMQAELWGWNAPLFEQPAYQAAGATLNASAGEAARTACELVRRQAVMEAAYEATPGRDEARVAAQASAAEGRALCGLVREVFGNPFRPVTIDPAWLAWSGGAVLAIAREIDDAQRLGELPYLADALTDAGCAEETLLRHLRGGGHVRGCWVLDAVLGRA